MTQSLTNLKLIMEPYAANIGHSICDRVLNDERFALFPASVSKHHCWEGGLVDHTLQVVYHSIRIAKAGGLDETTVAIAALWHDFGKTFDYCQVENKWAYNEHRNLIRHLPRSYAEFMIASQQLSESSKTKIGHCILSHHGILMAGSPVEPVTQEAWAVHLADMISVHCIENRKSS